MHGTTGDHSAIANLSLSDPACSNDACIAFKKAHEESQRLYSYYFQYEYGHWTTYWWVIILGLAALVHLARTVRDHRSAGATGAAPTDAAAGRPSLLARAQAARRLVTYRRLRGRFADAVHPPSTGVALLLALTTIFLAACTFAVQPYYRATRGYGSPMLAVRTGLMSVACTPILVALAGKANFVTWLTGLGHEKLNVFHRAAAYMSFVLAVVHTVPFFIADSQPGGAAALRAKFYAPGSYEYTGVPPFAMFVGLVALSIPPIRHRLYEAFYYLHHALALIYIGLMFWHCGDEGDSWAYMWATLAVYLGQSLWRMLWYNRATNLRAGAWGQGVPLTLRALPGGMTRVEVAAPPGFTWRPGQHAFLRLPALAPFDNHPFTIASAPPPSLPTSGPNAPDNPRAYETAAPTLTFLARSHAGFTRRLAAHGAALGPEGRAPDAWLDGPYGGAPGRPERRFDALLLVAGGAGVSAVLPWLLHLAPRLGAAGVRTRNVTLLWAVRRREHVAWAAAALGAAVRDARAARGGAAAVEKEEEPAVRVEIYVTRQDAAGAKAEKAPRLPTSDSEAPGEKALETEGVQEAEAETTEAKAVEADPETADAVDGLADVATVHAAHPCMAEVLPPLVRLRRTMVLACGPESLKIDISNTCARLQGRVLRGEIDEVALHTETFGW